MWYFLPWLACFSSGPELDFLDTTRPATRPAPTAPTAVSLAHADARSLQLPPSNRPDGALAPESFVVSGSFRYAPVRGETAYSQVYRAAMPVHRSLLPHRAGGTHSLGAQAPPGLQVFVQDGEEEVELPFAARAEKPMSWGFDAQSLFVGLRPGEPAPEHVRVVFPAAAQAEAARNLATSGQSPAAFVRQEATVGQTTYRGLYLPAPAEAVVRLTVPERGVLRFGSLLVAPSHTASGPSDGADVVVSVDAGGAREELAREPVQLGAPQRRSVDLSRWAGQTIDLVLATDPGATTDFDYVLLVDPVVYTPSARPRRMVLVFVDTLRPDHLGFMGYSRDTSPVLDRWAAHAAVFTEARTVAPWTLPSALALLSGRQPEQWAEAAPLADRLSAAGWRTDAFVSNAFLSQAFDTDRGWDHFDYEHLRTAPELVARARAALEAHGDRDQLVMVHFMEPHVPYDEPAAFQDLFAGPAPDGLRFPVGRGRVNRRAPERDNFDEIREYLIARYDQNIRAVDHALGPLLEAAGPDATVVLFSDHGEAFWEHGEFEHGHGLHDELLRVAMTIRSPGLPAGTLGSPVSLLDVTPTLLELAGLDPSGLDGRSLVPLAWGDDGVAERFATRPHVFGRPLYGSDGWGVQYGTTKWWDQAGYRYLYDLAADPGEQDNKVVQRDPPPMQPHVDVLQGALGRPVQRVWRLDVRSAHGSEVTVTVSHPEGFANAWLSYDPRGRTSRPAPTLDDGRVTLVVPALDDTVDVLNLVPRGDPTKPEGLAVTFLGRGLASGARVERPVDLGNGALREVFLRVGDPRFSALAYLSWVPEPSGTAVRGFHPDLQEQLEELGYLE